MVESKSRIIYYAREAGIHFPNVALARDAAIKIISETATFAVAFVFF